MPDPTAMRAGALDHLAGIIDVPAASLAVRPPAAKLSLRGGDAARAAAGAAFGVDLPVQACRFATQGDRSAFWLGPDEWLLQAASENPPTLFADIEAAIGDMSHALVDVSHRSESFSVSGPRAPYILNHGCPLDLSLDAFPVGMCTRTIYAKATIMLARVAPETFHIDVWRSFAPYVWQLLDEARGELV